MRCDAFERWLDDGMPEFGSAGAMAHAHDCRRCAPLLVAARAVEAALGTAPPEAPAGFTAAVMAGVGALEAPSPRQRLSERRAAPWWLEIASEPAVWVGLALAPALAVTQALAPRLAGAFAGVAEAAASAWSAAAALWIARLPSVVLPLGHTERGALAIGLALPLLWVLYRAPTWVAGSWGWKARASSRAPGSRPRSRG
ncbi:MAG TPA: hypothetical protein VF363_02365 [Candidatus Eisenbacteria bacterium]